MDRFRGLPPVPLVFFMRPEISLSALVVVVVIRILFLFSSSSLLVIPHFPYLLLPCPVLHKLSPTSNHPETAPSGRPSESQPRQSWRNLGFSPGRNLESAL